MRVPAAAVQAERRPPVRSGSWQRAWRSVDERVGLSALAYPVPRHANRLGYLLGGISLMGIVILFATGVWLAQFYNASPSGASQSVAYIDSKAPFGAIVRGIHVWTAYLVLVTLLLHLARALTTGSYKRPREVNWWTGVLLLALTLRLASTGDILRWDRYSYAAMTDGARAGQALGGLGQFFSEGFTQSVPLLGRIYVAHIAILPMLVILLVAAHLALVKRHGISPLPSDADRESGPVRPQARSATTFVKHIGLAAVGGLVLLGLSLVLTLELVPTLARPLAGESHPTRTLWMFLPGRALEDWFGASATVWAQAAMLGALAAVPLIDRGRYASPRRRVAVLAVWGLVATALVGLGAYAVIRV